ANARRSVQKGAEKMEGWLDRLRKSTALVQPEGAGEDDMKDMDHDADADYDLGRISLQNRRSRASAKTGEAARTTMIPAGKNGLPARGFYNSAGDEKINASKLSVSPSSSSSPSNRASRASRKSNASGLLRGRLSKVGKQNQRATSAAELDGETTEQFVFAGDDGGLSNTEIQRPSSKNATGERNNRFSAYQELQTTGGSTFQPAERTLSLNADRHAPVAGDGTFSFALNTVAGRFAHQEPQQGRAGEPVLQGAAFNFNNNAKNAELSTTTPLEGPARTSSTIKDSRPLHIVGRSSRYDRDPDTANLASFYRMVNGVKPGKSRTLPPDASLSLLDLQKKYKNFTSGGSSSSSAAFVEDARQRKSQKEQGTPAASAGKDKKESSTIKSLLETSSKN
ncbi:unnamed protein product, partial [Amoebophrya sp. A120]